MTNVLSLSLMLSLSVHVEVMLENASVLTVMDFTISGKLLSSTTE